MGAFAQRVKDAGKPRSRLWGFVLFTIACIVFYGAIVRSLRNDYREAASKQASAPPRM